MHGFLILSSHPGMRKRGEDLPSIILTGQDLLVKMLIRLEPHGILIKFCILLHLTLTRRTAETILCKIVCKGRRSNGSKILHINDTALTLVKTALKARHTSAIPGGIVPWLQMTGALISYFHIASCHVCFLFQMGRRVFLKLNRKKTYRKRKLVAISSPPKIKRVAFSPRHVSSPLRSNGTPLSTPKSKGYGKRPRTPSSLTKKKPKKLNFGGVTNVNECISLDAEFGDNDNTPEYKDYDAAMFALTEGNKKETVQTFLKLVSEGRFPIDNIAFHLFCDTVEFYDKADSRRMRYSDKSKTFWWTGRKLFHGQFIRFMQGIRSTPQNENVRALEPQSAHINFAVPHTRSLIDYNPVGVGIPQKLDPGFHSELANLAKQAFNESSVVLSVDGKKITPGLTESFGDIDLLGFEKGETLEQRKDDLVQDNVRILDFISFLNKRNQTTITEYKDTLIEYVNKMLNIAWRHVRALRESEKDGQLAVERFKLKGGDNWKSSKFHFVINSLETLLLRMENCLSDLMAIVKQLCHLCAICNDSDNNFAHGNSVDMGTQLNFVELKAPEEVKTGLTPETTKQRSDKWHELRKEVKLTGSSLHRGLGLDGLKRQKEHFNKVYCDLNQDFSEEQKKCMHWGVENEIHATATFASVVMPVLFPGMVLHEEGAHFIIDDGRPLIEVSPDGSMRNDAEIIGIEIKCPVPEKKYATDVHYQVPVRYGGQCLAEMQALNGGRCKQIYVCWSPKSTTVFELKNDQNVWDQIIAETNNTLYTGNPRSPTRRSAESKRLSEEMTKFVVAAVFLGEFPSVKGYNSGRPATDDSPYLKPKKKEHMEASSDSNSCSVVLKHTLACVEKLKSSVHNSYNLRRKKASEVVTFIVTDTDRQCAIDKLPLVPVAYFLRGYSLSCDIVRKIVNSIHQQLNDFGLHIPVVTLDGEWSKLVFESAEGRSLTMLNLQKKFYSSLKHESKHELISFFRKLNIYTWDKSGCQLVVGLQASEQKVKTPTDGWKCRSKAGTEKSPALPSDVISSGIDSLLDREASQLQTLLQVDESIRNEISVDVDITSLPNDEEEVHKIPDGFFDAVNDVNTDAVLSELNEPSLQINVINSTQEVNIDNVQDSSMHMADNRVPFVIIELSEWESLLKLLQISKVADKWAGKTVQYLKECCINASSLSKQTDGSLSVILRYLKPKLKACGNDVPISIKKAEKVNVISKVIGDGSRIDPVKRKCHVKKVPHLRELCIKVLNTKKYPKEVLVIARANYEFPAHVKKWWSSAHTPEKLNVSGNEVCLYYQPEWVSERNQLEVKVLDGHHLLTNLRTKTCRGGIEGISKYAWVKVAESGHTPLKLAMVEDILDQQSDGFARTHFSPPVENAMRDLGFHNEAYLCHLITDWVKAEDEPGLSATDRLHKRLALRQWLLKDVDLFSFPPPGRYVKGMPIINWEGFVASIDAHILLYGLTKTGTYNTRAITTLAVEQFNGMIENYDESGRPSVTADTYRKTLGDICMLSALQISPDR